MDKVELKRLVVSTLVSDYGIREEDIKDESTLEDLQLDSLDAVEFVMTLEDGLDECIDSDEIMLDMSISTLCDNILEQLS